MEQIDVEKVEFAKQQQELAARRFQLEANGGQIPVPAIGRLTKERKELQAEIGRIEREQEQIEQSSNQSWRAAKSAVSLSERQWADQMRGDAKARYDALEASKNQLRRQVADINERLQSLPSEYLIACYKRDSAERDWFRVEGGPWTERKEEIAKELISALWNLYRIEERDQYLDEARKLRLLIDDESPFFVAPHDSYRLPDGKVVDEDEMTEWAATNGSRGITVFAGKGKRILKDEARRLNLLTEVTK